MPEHRVASGRYEVKLDAAGIKSLQLQGQEFVRNLTVYRGAYFYEGNRNTALQFPTFVRQSPTTTGFGEIPFFSADCSVLSTKRPRPCPCRSDPRRRSSKRSTLPTEQRVSRDALGGFDSRRHSGVRSSYTP